MKINLPKISVGINLIKAILWLKNLREKPQEVITMKEKKTELWITSIAALLAIVMNVLGVLQPELTVKIVAALSAVYTVGRTLVKMTATKLDDRAIEELGKLINK